MSLQVFFDNTLIDEKYYTGLTNNFELFSDTFKLGATPSNTYKLNIAKDGVSTQPSAITLKDNGTTFANLNIDNAEEQDYTYDYTLTDKMIDLDFNYDASEIFVDDKTTLLAIAQDICTKVGLTLGTNNFRGYNKEITWYDNRKTARQYIGYIAELNGGFARIENNTLYFRKQKTNSIKTISIDDCENFNIGEYHKITRVVYELGALKYEYGDETGNTLYLDSENVFITEQSEVQAIYNDIKNFEFYSFETDNCPIDYSVKAGDVITFTDRTNNYPTIAQYDLEYFGGWIGGYSLSVATKRQEETQVIGTKEHVKNLQIIVDRDANRIDEIVETTIPEIEEQIEVITDTTGTGTGKFIHLDDCSDQTFNSIVMNGETSQVTRSGKNLLNKNATVKENGASKTVLSTGVRATALADGNYKYFAIEIGQSELLGKTLTISATISPSSNNNGFIILYYGNSSTAAVSSASTGFSTTGSETRTLLSSFPSNCDRVYALFYGNRNGTGVTGDYVNYANLQIEIGSTATSYEPYGVMPSLDYPSKTKNADGRNLFDVNTVSGSTVNRRVDIVDNKITITALTTVGAQSVEKYIYGLDKEKYYKLSFRAKKTVLGTTGQPYIRIYVYGSNDRTNYTLVRNAYQSSPVENKEYFFNADSVTGYTSYRFYIYNNCSTPVTVGEQTEYWDIQFEEGRGSTPFVPYDNLEIKVGNKNILDIRTENIISATDGLTEICSIENGVITLNGTPSQSGNIYFYGFKVDAGQYAFSTNLRNYTPIESGNASILLQQSTDNTNWSTKSEINSKYPTDQTRIITLDAEHFYRIRVYLTSSCTFNNTTYSLQLEKSSEVTEFVANEHQTAYFPLQGEHLMRGDYIDKDGIHHNRKKITFDGSSDEVWKLWALSATNVERFYILINSNANISNSKCDSFIYETGNADKEHYRQSQSTSGGPLDTFVIFINKSRLSAVTAAGLKTYLAEHPITLEYKLYEEELTPFTTDQQQAWDEISLLTTYKRITNISSDASLDIEYLKDNGLDVYETRSSAEVTKSQVSRLTIEEGRIASEVSSTKSSLNNYYTKDESDDYLQSTSDELKNIISQNKTEAEQTANNIALRVSSIETNGTSKVQTTTGYTFDDEGLKIDKTGAVTSSVIDNEAFKVKEKSSNQEVFFAGYVSDQNSDYRGQTIVKSTNLVVKNYLNIEGASRFQPYVNQVLGGHGTGAFDIG